MIILNKELRYGVLPANEKGRVISLPVDQTPVLGQKRSVHGFYKSDIALLLDASSKGDKAMFEKLANRLEMVSPEPENNKTIEQLFDEWKPAYLQTMSELQAWPAYLKSTHPDVYERLYGEEDRKFETDVQKPVVDKETADLNPVSNE